MADNEAYDHNEALLSPLELHILDLCADLATSIAALVGDDDSKYPLGEFDQRLLLEHTQLIERYVLAQAGARAYPDYFRLIGQSVPSTTAAAVTDERDDKQGEHGHSHTDGHDQDHDHGHDHPGAVEQHLATDPTAAREAHRQGRAIIGEHPWAHDHDHGEGHEHPDEWEWEPLDRSAGE